MPALTIPVGWLAQGLDAASDFSLVGTPKTQNEAYFFAGDIMAPDSSIRPYIKHSFRDRPLEQPAIHSCIDRIGSRSHT